MNAIADTRRANFEHRFFLLTILAIFAVVATGFARTYFLRPLFFHDPLPLLLHVHGALMIAWFALFFTQTCLIASHRVQWHKRLGVFGVMLALAILVVAPVVLVQGVARELHAPHGHRGFTVIFGLDLVILFDFAVLVASAIALRHRSDFHKRLMLLATCAIILPAIARIPALIPIGVLGVLLLFYCCVLVPVIVDTVRHRRLHPTFGWGAPLLIASEQLAFYAAHTPTWTQFVIRLFA
ncbi:MAG: hypothetical protein JSS28_01175 [Proteobacteria bacterium]|nr:hypothetical protein [Pseudomonadota bacterium]